MRNIAILSAVLTVVVILTGCPTPTKASFKYTPENKTELLKAIEAEIETQGNNANLSNINTGKITDMSNLFNGNKTFNGNISKWDLSKVTNMAGMFQDAAAFNGDISGWKPFKVTDISRMFQGARAFNQNISAWNLTAVVKTVDTFKDSGIIDTNYPQWLMGISPSAANLAAYRGLTLSTASKIGFTKTPSSLAGIFSINPKLPTGLTIDGNTGIISGKPTVASTEATYTITLTGSGDFEGKIVTTQLSIAVNRYKYTPATKAELETAINTEITAQGNAANLNIIDTSNIIDMKSLFHNKSRFNGDISEWNVSKVTNMWNMFLHAESFNGDISKWDVSNVKNMGFMFSQTNMFNNDISKWNVNSVTNMSNMFDSAKAFNQNIASWDVSKVTSMTSMLQNTNSFNVDISDWDVGSVTTMTLMFYRATAFNQNLENWGTHLTGRTVSKAGMFNESGMTIRPSWCTEETCTAGFP